MLVLEKKKQLVVGKVYKNKDLAEFIGIRPQSFSRNKDKYIQQLSEFYEIKPNDYGLGYKIIKVLAPYDPNKYKNNKLTKEYILRRYRNAVRAVLDSDPYNSGANVGRVLALNQEFQAEFHHSEKTAANYARIVISEEYIREEYPYWCSYDEYRHHYELLDEEMMEDWRKIYTKYKLDKAHMRWDTEDSLEDDLTYKDALFEFKAIWGFCPRLIYKYVKRQQE